MLVKLVIGSAGGIALAFAATMAAWWFFVRDDAQLADEPPAIPAVLARSTPAPASIADPFTLTESSSTQPVDGTDGLTFKVVSDSSEAAYFADEQLASVGLPSTAKGTTTDIAGTFFLSADGWTLDAAQSSTFTVDLTTLTSDEDRRDGRVQEALETATYPSATFTVSGINRVDSTLGPEETQTFEMTGTLDLHGVQREITWTVEARREGNVMTALATTNFRFDDFGITPPNVAGFVSVQDDVTLQLQIIAQAI